MECGSHMCNIWNSYYLLGNEYKTNIKGQLQLQFIHILNLILKTKLPWPH